MFINQTAGSLMSRPFLCAVVILLSVTERAQTQDAAPAPGLAYKNYYGQRLRTDAGNRQYGVATVPVSALPGTAPAGPLTGTPPCNTTSFRAGARAELSGRPQWQTQPFRVGATEALSYTSTSWNAQPPSSFSAGGTDPGVYNTGVGRNSQQRNLPGQARQLESFSSGAPAFSSRNNGGSRSWPKILGEPSTLSKGSPSVSAAHSQSLVALLTSPSFNLTRFILDHQGQLSASRAELPASEPPGSGSTLGNIGQLLPPGLSLDQMLKRALSIQVGDNDYTRITQMILRQICSQVSRQNFHSFCVGMGA